MNKEYKKERIKLTGLYFGIIFLIVVIFSAIVINTQNKQFGRLDRFKNVRTVDIPAPPMSFAIKPASEDLEEVERIVKDIKAQNLRSIILLDALILILASILSYYLSGRTLEPILDFLNKQKRFVSDASHELKTPLTTIKTEAEVMNRSKSTTVEEYRDFTKNVIDDVDHLNNLVTYLLEAARLENNSFVINKQDVNLVELSETLVEKFRKQAESKDVTINFKSEEAEIRTYNDKTLIQRLISILIDNAIKYNNEKGKVTVSVFLNLDNEPCIEVRDNGVGIPGEKLPKIFDKFYRISEDRNEKSFGLGLSIAKQIAIDLGVDIEVESRVGKGSVFKIILY